VIPGLDELVSDEAAAGCQAKPDEPMTDVVRGSAGDVRAIVTRITEHVQSDLVLMLKLKRAGIQPGREVLLGAVEGGVRVFGGTADGADGDADNTDADGAVAPTDLPADVAAHVFVSRELGSD
jgi:DtxR family Mn-dependent transcriptional regulator